MNSYETERYFVQGIDSMLRCEDPSMSRAMLELALLNGVQHIRKDDSAELYGWDYLSSYAMVVAAAANNVGVMQLLFDSGVDVDASTQLEPPILLACKNANHEAVAWLLEHGAESWLLTADNDEESSDDSLLYHAIRSGSIAVVRLLLEHGANPNIHFIGTECCNGATPLHLAVYEENAAILEELLKAGADLNETNDAGQTPVAFASKTGKWNPQILRLLVESEDGDPDPLLLEYQYARLGTFIFRRIFDSEPVQEDTDS